MEYSMIINENLDKQFEIEKKVKRSNGEIRHYYHGYLDALIDEGKFITAIRESEYKLKI